MPLTDLLNRADLPKDVRAEIQRHVAELEALIEERTENYRSLTDGIQAPIMRYDSEGRHLFQNAIGYSLSGFSEKEFIGKTHRELGFDEDLCALWEEHIQRVFRTGESSHVEFEWESSEGPISYDWHVYPELDPDGRVRSAVAISYDITESRKKAAERETLIAELESAAEQIKTLRGIVPICSYCNLVDSGGGVWEKMDTYMRDHTEAQVGHRVCPTCADKIISNRVAE
jgi:PAS domain S-box-containing protein